MKYIIGILFFVFNLISVNAPAKNSYLDGVKMVNYYSSDSGWNYFWERWDPEKIRKDFHKIRKIGFNTVRIFIQPQAVGYPKLTSVGRDKISQLFFIAGQENLKITPTFFDLWGNYTDVTGSRQWVDSVREAVQDPRQIAYIDLKNEVVIQDIKTMQWLKAMVPYTQEKFIDVPVTFSMVIGVTRPIESSILLAISNNLKPDLWDVHYYMPPSALSAEIQKVRSVIDGASVILGETGASSYAAAKGHDGSGDCSLGEQEQANYLKEIETTLHSLNLPFGGVWAYSDFSKTAIPLNLHVAQKPTEYCFGLFSVDGHPKAAANAIFNMLAQ